MKRLRYAQKFSHCYETREPITIIDTKDLWGVTDHYAAEAKNSGVRKTQKIVPRRINILCLWVIIMSF